MDKMSEGRKKLKIKFQSSQTRKMKEKDDGKPLDLSTKVSSKSKHHRECDKQTRKREKRLVTLIRERQRNASKKMYDDVTMETAQTLLQLKSSVSPPQPIPETSQENETCSNMPQLTSEICRQNVIYRRRPRLLPETSRGNEAYRNMPRLIPEIRQGNDTGRSMSRFITEIRQDNDTGRSMSRFISEIRRRNDTGRRISRIIPDIRRGNDTRRSMSRLIPEIRRGNDTSINMSRFISESRQGNEVSRSMPPLIPVSSSRSMPPLIPIPNQINETSILNQPSTSSVTSWCNQSANNPQILVEGDNQQASTSGLTFISPRTNHSDQQQVLRQQSVIMSPISSNQFISSAYLHQPMEVPNQEAHTSGAYFHQHPSTSGEFWRPIPFPETPIQTSRNLNVPISLESRNQAHQNLETARALLSLSKSPAKVFDSSRKKTGKRTSSTARHQYGPSLPSSRTSQRTQMVHPLNITSAHASILSYDIDSSRRAQIAMSSTSSNSTHQPVEELNESHQLGTESTSMLRPPPYYSVHWKPQVPQTEARGVLPYSRYPPSIPINLRSQPELSFSNTPQRNIPPLGGYSNRATIQRSQSLQFLNEIPQQNSSQFFQSPTTWLSRPPLYFVPVRCRPTVPQPPPPQFPPPVTATGYSQALRQYNNDPFMPNRPMWPRPSSYFPQENYTLSSHQEELRVQPNEQSMLVQANEDPDDPNNWDVDINKIMEVLQTVNFDLSDDDY